MSASIKIIIQIGPMVAIEAEGDTCADISEALAGWENMNAQIDRLSTDLAGRVFPGDPDQDQKAK